MAKDKRVEVLFESQQYKRLEEAAHREGKSVGALVREAVAKYVVAPTEEERQAAVDRILSGEYAIGPVGSPEEIKKEITDAMYERTMKSVVYDQDPDEAD